MSPKPTSGECKRGDFSHMSRAQRDQMEYELFAMFVQLRLIGQGPGLRKSALILARFTDTCPSVEVYNERHHCFWLPRR